jgi:uncharacterized protein
MEAPSAPGLRRGLPAHLRPHVRAALAEAKTALEALYGDRLVHLILYGSQARGDARDDSDVDLLIVLRGEVRPYEEIKRAASATWDLALDHHDVYLSVNPYDEASFGDRTRPFIQNVLEDGVEL